MSSLQADNATLETSVSVADILDQIAVKEPYFALRDLHLSKDGEISAAVHREQPMGLERAVMTGAEVGRHLAILGSCAAARQIKKPGKHFYLAEYAHLRFVSSGLDLEPGKLVGKARAEFTEKRIVEAKTRLLHGPSAKVLYELDVKYQVLPVKMFERFFAEYRDDSPLQEKNPYASELIAPGDVFCIDDMLSANVGPLDPTMCAGHFPRYPTYPVAVLAFILIRSAGRLLQEVTEVESIPYTVVNAQVQAPNLAAAKDKLHLVIQHKETENDGQDFVFRCRALAERGMKQLPFGDMRITLRRADVLTDTT